MKGDIDVSVNKIIQSLEELVQIHERLIQISKKKTDIIKVGSSVTPDDYAKLQKEMRRIQEENEILKKAMAIFARK